MNQPQGLVSSITLSSNVRPATHHLGVRGGGFAATVNERGAITMDAGERVVNWFVAADDRWHTPAIEQGVRQQRRAGVPVVETRVRIPGGDAVQRVWSVPDFGGLIVMEITNDSTLPIAVAFDSPEVICDRTPSPLGPQGIELPQGSVVFPIGHTSSLRFALRPSASQGAVGSLATLPGHEQLQRGWLASVERAGYAVLPDKALPSIVNRLRSDALVYSAHDIEDWPEDFVARGDDVAVVLALHQMMLLGEDVSRHVEAIAECTERNLSRVRKSQEAPWDVERALYCARHLFVACDEERAARDVARAQGQLADATSPPNVVPKDVRAVAWMEEMLVSPRRDGSVGLVQHGIPTLWRGVNFECHRIVASPEHTVSYGVRWHGSRPALLWEVGGPFGLRLGAGVTDPAWSTTDPAGDALLS
ncbi:MAG: hypothetical protein ACO3LA_05580 [Ilumatobacteraceae bacterium]